jgi:hypothetical protein
MSELDAEWERRVTEAVERARSAGRADLAEYLTLRAANDMARAVGVAWLFETFNALADEALLRGVDLKLETEEEHRFRVAHSTMVGRSLTLRAGLVRALTVEAGWPRAPRDGVVRGGGIVHARITHFGDRSADEELLLVKSGEDAPRWLVLSDAVARDAFDESRARDHFAKLLA